MLNCTLNCTLPGSLALQLRLMRQLGPSARQHIGLVKAGLRRASLVGMGLTATTLALTALATRPVMAQTTSLEEQLRQTVSSSELTQARDVADQLLRLGRQLAAAGQYDSAIRAWEQSIELYYEIGDRIGMGTAYENIAQTYGVLGRYDDAETAVRRQLSIARDNGNFQDQIYAWNTLGTLRLQRGLLDSALQGYEEALTVAQSVEDYEGMGLSLSNLGLVASIQGDYATAIDYFETAGQLRSRAGNRLGQANTNNRLGDAYRASGDLDRAIGAYRVTLWITSDLDNSTDAQLQALDGLIDIYIERADWFQMRYHLDERLALLSTASGDLNRSWQQLLNLRYLGIYYSATGSLPEAQSAYQQALTLARQLEQKTLERELSNRLRTVNRTLAAEG